MVNYIFAGHCTVVAILVAGALFKIRLFVIAYMAGRKILQTQAKVKLDDLEWVSQFPFTR